MSTNNCLAEPQVVDTQATANNNEFEINWQNHLQRCQSLAKIGSWETDISTGEFVSVMPVFWSDEFYRLLGYEPGTVELPGDYFYRASHPDDIHILNEHYNSLVKTGGEFEFEHRLITPDGSIKTVISKGEFILKDGKPYRMVGTTQDITAYKNTNNKLLASANRMKTIFNNMKEIFFTVDMVSYRVEFVSAACEQVYGYPPSAFYEDARLWFSAIIDEDKPKVEENNKGLREGKKVEQEYRIRHRDGSIRWIESVIFPTIDDKGNLISIDGFSYDITQRRSAEKALQDSETKFRSLIQNSSDGILIIDEADTIVFASDSYYKMSGFSADEIIGSNTYGFVHPEDLERVRAHKDSIINQPERTLQIQYRRRVKSGDYRWVEGATTDMLEKPEVKGIILNLRDITERLEAEQAVKNSEHKLRSLISQSSDAITITNKDLKLSFANESLFRMSGYSSLQDITLDHIHPDDIEESKSFLQWLLDHPGESRQMVFRFRKSDGTYIWVERASTNLMHDPAINGIISNFRDVTERRVYIETLQKTNHELEKSNLELDKFVYRVSHDLRAPLLSILGLIELAQIEENRQLMLDYMGMMKESVQKLDSFIRDILDYSRNARVELKEENIPLHEMVKEISNHLKFIDTGNERVTLLNEVPEDSMIVSDRNRIAVILNNLISNAIRYYNPDVSEPYVQVGVKLDTGCVQLYVKDNGIGIAEDQHEKIFDMFYRASSKSIGSGLGLYIVKETVEKLNASIKLISAPGKGSEFIISLPQKPHSHE